MTPQKSLMTLQRLLSWTSPSFPIGAFSYSGGLESAIEQGLVHNLNSLNLWLDSQRSHGRLHMDAWYLRASMEKPETELNNLSNQCLAQNSSVQMRNEAEALGAAMARTLGDSWNLSIETGAYPVVFGSACKAMEIEANLALCAFAHSYIANQISVACRVIPLGQTDGQKCLYAHEEKIIHSVEAWLSMDITTFPFTSTLQADLLAQAHEIQYSRMFRS